ncbi:MAG: hypothetical protein Tsb0020_27060 [Haliangiales bacterium]
MGKAIAHDLTLAGLCMSQEEWLDMDEHLRLELLQILFATSPTGAAYSPAANDSSYDSYELTVDMSALDEPRDLPEPAAAMAR